MTAVSLPYDAVIRGRVSGDPGQQISVLGMIIPATIDVRSPALGSALKVSVS